MEVDVDVFDVAVVLTSMFADGEDVFSKEFVKHNFAID
jgi:hypothetical protein